MGLQASCSVPPNAGKKHCMGRRGNFVAGVSLIGTAEEESVDSRGYADQYTV